MRGSTYHPCRALRLAPPLGGERGLGCLASGAALGKPVGCIRGSSWGESGEGGMLEPFVSESESVLVKVSMSCFLVAYSDV